MIYLENLAVSIIFFSGKCLCKQEKNGQQGAKKRGNMKGKTGRVSPVLHRARRCRARASTELSHQGRRFQCLPGAVLLSLQLWFQRSRGLQSTPFSSLLQILSKLFDLHSIILPMSDVTFSWKFILNKGNSDGRETLKEMLNIFLATRKCKSYPSHTCQNG